MKYIGFLFRDLDNNFVLAHQDAQTKELQFNIMGVEGVSYMKPHELPLNQVDVVEVTETQEDECVLTPKLRLEAVDLKNKAVDLAMLSETDEQQFIDITDRLYESIMKRC